MGVGILGGLRIVEISAFVAAPLGGATLAAMGADVIRVDPPGGGVDIGRWPLHRGRSLYWAGLNQGKRSVTIDMRQDSGQEKVAKLITAPGEGGGIFLTNLPVLGWNSYDTLKKLRGDLIMVVITGNRDGSAAVDYTVNAALGFPFVTGPEDAEGPVNHVLPAWDAMTGTKSVDKDGHITTGPASTHVQDAVFGFDKNYIKPAIEYWTPKRGSFIGDEGSGAVASGVSGGLEMLAYGKERIVISRKGKRLAAMVPIEDLELLEALEDKTDLAAARKALKAPGSKSWEQFKKERGL